MTANLDVSKSHKENGDKRSVTISPEVSPKMVDLCTSPKRPREEEVTPKADEKDSPLQHVTKRIKRLCPKLLNDLIRTLYEVRCSRHSITVAMALEHLYVLLDQEKAGDDITSAFYWACGHVEILNATKRHKNSLAVQYWGLNVLGCLSYNLRLNRIAFQDKISLKQSMVSVGVMDQIRKSFAAFPKDSDLTGVALGVLNNLYDLYSFPDLFQRGFISLALDESKRFPVTPNVQYIAAEALLKAAQAPKATKSKLQSVGAVSALARVLERFHWDRSKDGIWVYKKADEALKTILALRD